MAGARIRKVNEAIREVLSHHVTEGLSDPRIGFVTLTAVETSSDLAHARVFLTILGPRKKRAEALEGLRSARGVLQAHLGRELHMKRTPTLEFVYDESIDHGMKMDALIDRATADGPA